MGLLYHKKRCFSRVSVYNRVQPHALLDKDITHYAFYHIGRENTGVKINNIYIGKTAEYKCKRNVDNPDKTAVEDKGKQSFAA